MNFPGGDAAKAGSDFVVMVHRVVEHPPGRYRVEDVLSAAASFVGEVCLRRAGDFDVDSHTFNPGAPIFSDKVNELLSGNRSEWAEIPVTSTFGGVFLILTKAPEDERVPDVLGAIAATSLSALLFNLRAFIAPSIAVTIAMETINAMAKTAPMLQKHMDEWVRAPT
jgi:hypothetical protein